MIRKFCVINLFVFGMPLLSMFTLQAQTPYTGKTYHPVKLTFFTESIGLPGFGRFFKQGGFGFRIGTEFSYTKKEQPGFFHAVNLGFYSHKDFSTAFYISTEAGYRHFFGRYFTDATLGAGIQFSQLSSPSYQSTGTGYKNAKGALVRFIPVAGLGTGCSFNKTLVFARYEFLFETPFGYNDIPFLPHQTIHVGTQFHF